MLSFFALCVVICGQEGTPIQNSPATAAKPAEVRRPFHEIQNELSDLLKREALTKNRTFHAYRWKDVAIAKCATREQAEVAFADLLATSDYRLEERIG